jgi:hypothetical protein
MQRSWAAVPYSPEQVIDIFYMTQAGTGKVSLEILQLVLYLFDLIVRDKKPRIFMSHSCHSPESRFFLPMYFLPDIVIPVPFHHQFKEWFSRCGGVLIYW